MGQIKHPASTHRRVDERRKAAEELTASRAERSAQEQLKRLDEKLGKGKGAKKERRRLKAEIKAAQK